MNLSHVPGNWKDYSCGSQSHEGALEYSSRHYIYIFTVYILICRTRKRRGDERRNKNSFDIFWQMLRTSMLFGYIFYLVRPCLTAQVPSQRRLLRKLSRLERGAGVRLQQRFGFVFHVLFHPRACGACRTNPMSKRNISILEQTGSQSDEGALVCSVRGEEKQKGCLWGISSI